MKSKNTLLQERINEAKGDPYDMQHIAEDLYYESIKRQASRFVAKDIKKKEGRDK